MGISSLRTLFALYCGIAGLVSVGIVIFCVDHFLQAFGSAAITTMVLVAIPLLASLALTGLFAHGISCARHGPVSTKRWLSCVAAGAPAFAVFLIVISRRSWFGV